MNGNPRTAASVHRMKVARLRGAYAAAGAALALVDPESPTDASLEAFDHAREGVEAAHNEVDHHLLRVLGKLTEDDGEEVAS